MEYFPRKLQDRINPWLDKPDVIFISGARQVGKTTLLEILRQEAIRKWGDSKNIHTFNLEDSDQLTALNRDPKYLKDYLKLSGAEPHRDSIVMIDEVQYLDDPSHFIKFISDMEPSIKLIVTGSTSIAIKKFKDGMTGRKKTFTLFPLDFEEFLWFKGNESLTSVYKEFHFRNLVSRKAALNPERIKPFHREMQVFFEEFILYGGYPKVVLTESRKNKLEELRELFETYELKDVNVIFNVANIQAFRNLFKLMAGNVSGLINVNELSDTLGIGRDTVNRYLSILENSFIIQILPPFHNNIRKELSKMPKAYFLDTGLRNYALRNFSELDFRPDKGPLFENSIFSELYKNLDIIEQLYFWRTISKTEVDFVLIGDPKWAIEVKLTGNNRLQQPAGHRAFKKVYPDFKQVVISSNRYGSNKDILFLPGWMI